MSRQAEFIARLQHLLDVEPRLTPVLQDLTRRLAAGSPASKTFPAEIDRNAVRACFGDFVRFNARDRAVLRVKKLAARLGGEAQLAACLAAVLPAQATNADATKELRREHDNPAIERLLASRAFHNWAQDAADNTIQQATACAEALLERLDLSYSHAGARFFNDSKVLRPGAPLHQVLGGWLKQEFDLDGSLEDAFLRCGVFTNPTAVHAMIYGPVVYTKAGTERTWIHDLWQEGEAAILHLDHLDRADKFRLTTDCLVHSCENESPFYELVKRREVDCIVYTEGYPNSAVCSILQALHPPVIRHWGDTDVDGWLIAALLNRIAPVEPWRCTLADASRLAAALRPLDRIKRGRAREILLKDLSFPFRKELEFAINHGWLEQEAWQAQSDV